MCHYQNYTTSEFSTILNLVNTIIGGNPIETSILEVNALVEAGASYAILDPNGPLLFGLGAIEQVSHPATGTWFVPAVIDFNSAPSYVVIENVGIRGLNTVYKLLLKTYDEAPYNLGVLLEAGNGTMLNGSLLGSDYEALPFQTPPVTIQLEMDIRVDATRGHNPPVFETLADNQFRVELQFGGINLTAVQQILVNRTDLFTLSAPELSNPQCILAFIDGVSVEELLLVIADFNVRLPNPGTNPGQFGRNPTTCNGQLCKLGVAIDTLRDEAAVSNLPVPPDQSKPLAMLNVALSNLADVGFCFHIDF
jgi:hypothetical protein